MEQFDVIYHMLSKREQYQVIDILNRHDIEIIDENEELERIEGSQQIDSEHREDHPETETESINKYVGELFVNPAASSTQASTAYDKIKQSNEILCYLIQIGNSQAAQDLCRKNRGLVLKYAYSYYRFFGNDLDMEDLEQAGYYFMASAILTMDGALMDRLQAGLDMGFAFYEKYLADHENLEYYDRLRDLGSFASLPEDRIRSSGYVVDALEGAVWALVNTGSFEAGLLKAVNLGDDTDTVGAIAGGLAGLYYGYEAIPEEWLSAIQRRDWVEGLCADNND